MSGPFSYLRHELLAFTFSGLQHPAQMATITADPVTRRSRVSPITSVGLFVALFGMLFVRSCVNYFYPEVTVGSAMLKEGGMAVVGLIILLIVRFGEGLPLTSIGLTTTHLVRSFLWSLLLAAICFVVAGVFVALTHFNGGKNAAILGTLPVWVVTIVVFRAGIVEELCYRGYAIERLHALGVPRPLAAAIPLVVFAVGHWTGGLLNIGIAFLLGAVLAVFYLWRRDLLANMLGHTLVDFIPNVLPRLLR